MYYIWVYPGLFTDLTSFKPGQISVIPVFHRVQTQVYGFNTGGLPGVFGYSGSIPHIDYRNTRQVIVIVALISDSLSHNTNLDQALRYSRCNEAH